MNDQIPVSWLVLGFAAQACFFGRFLVQWVYSEMRRRSVVPVAFWYLSILGGGGLLTYAVFRADPVIITGQAFGLLVYSRNLWLVHVQRRSEGAGAES